METKIFDRSAQLHGHLLVNHGGWPVQDRCN